MNLMTIPLRNVRRRPSKAILLFLIFTLGVISIVTLYEVSLVVGHSFEKKLTAYGANIVISPATEKLSISYGGFHMGDMLFDHKSLPEESTVQAIQSIELNSRLSAIAPKLISMIRVDGVAAALVGVRWEQELRIKSYWAPQGAFPSNNNEILLGSKASQKLELRVGDTVNLLSKEFTVSGVLLETGGDDDSVIFMNLGTLQQLLEEPGATSFIEVAALCSGCPIEDIVAQLSQVLPGIDVKALQSVVNQRMASVMFVQKMALMISIVILITAAAMVGLSMLSAVNERKKEIGILRSLGYGKRKIFNIFCVEAGLIGFASGCFGYIVGFAASFKVLELLNIMEGGAPVFSFMHLLFTSISFGLITILAAFYPAWRGAKIDPSTALVAL